MRLTLEAITLNNFKSYKGLHHIKNIDKSFTAIVGPNGSGKSNIIDSILFVLGFRAKKMRHSQITDLIYNDGKKENSCFVELIFNKFKVKREVHINKSTKYYYNDKEISNSELVKIMMNENIDMEHNRFLILQGEIESIAMMKPKDGLLEFLEDIIGTSRYVQDINEISETVKNMEEDNIIMENNLKFNKTEYEHINELKMQNENILMKKIEFNKALKEYKELNLEISERCINEYKAEELEIIEKIKNLKNANQETDNLLFELETECNNIKELLKAQESKHLKLKREYKQQDRENEILKEEKSRLEKQLNHLKSDIDRIKSKYEMKIKERAIYEKELEENMKEIEELENKMKFMQEEIKKEENKISINDKKKLKELEDELLRLIKKKMQEEENSNKLLVEHKYYNEQLYTLEKEISETRNKISEIKSKSISKYKSKSEMVKEKNKLENELKELETDIEKTQRELQKRKMRYNEVSQRQVNDIKENEIMKHLRKVEGVVGRLKDIGHVNSKYDIALKISCSRLNNIIVDTTTTAEKCIEIINKNNLQRSTFIILDKIKEIPFLEKQNVPYMYELVECDDKYKKIFYFALSDTLLATDLDEAQKLAFGNFRRRVVTLDGKLIEKSGIMTGGKYHEKAKKYEDIEQALIKMNKIKEEKGCKLQDINNIEELETLQNKLTIKEKEYNNIKSKLDSHKPIDISDYDIKIESIKKDINNYKQKFESIYRAELQLISEKMEILESRNQDIRIWLSESIESYDDKEEDYKRKEEVFSKIKIRDLTKLRNKVKEEEEIYNNILEEFKNLQNKVNELKAKMGDDYKLEVSLNTKLENIREENNALYHKMEKEKCELRRLEDEIQEIGKHIRFSEDQISNLKDLSKDELVEYIKMADKKLKKAKQEYENKEVDYNIFEEYNKIKDCFEKAKVEFDNQIYIFEKKKKEIDNLKKKRHEEFMCGLEKINIFLKEIYNKLTFGGNAELELIDYLDPFSDGIKLVVMPPKKCWKDVSNLSGGEKTLSSLSLIFALHKYKPSPFYIMDEIDAALDFRNVSIISGYIKEMARNSQFIVISLRNDMFEISNCVLGVYKINNVSKFLMININEIKKKLLK